MLNENYKIKEDEHDSYCPFCFEKNIHITKIDNYFDVFFEGELADETDAYDFISEYKGFCNLCGGKWIDYYDADDQHLLSI